MALIIIAGLSLSSCGSQDVASKTTTSHSTSNNSKDYNSGYDWVMNGYPGSNNAVCSKSTIVFYQSSDCQQLVNNPCESQAAIYASLLHDINQWAAGCNAAWLTTDAPKPPGWSESLGQGETYSTIPLSGFPTSHKTNMKNSYATKAYFNGWNYVAGALSRKEKIGFGSGDIGADCSDAYLYHAPNSDATEEGMNSWSNGCQDALKYSSSHSGIVPAK